MIKKSKTSSNFTIISNNIINSSLSGFAKLMMQYLLSKPEDWKVKVSDLRKSLTIGRDKAYATIKELKQAGYMEHVVKRSKQGWVVSHDYIVYSEPQQRIIDKYAAEAESERTELTELSQSEEDNNAIKSEVELEETAMPADEAIDNIVQFPAPEDCDLDDCYIGSGGYVPSRKEQDAHFEKIFLPQMFEQFWQAYPLKINKIKAKAAFIKAGKKHSIAEILDGLNNYVANKPNYQAWMHPTTFLNGERWNDEYSNEHQSSKFNNSANNKQRPETIGELITARMLKIGEQGFSF